MSECRHGIPFTDLCDACTDEIRDYFSPRHATAEERRALDKALGRSMKEVPDPEIATLRAQLAEARARLAAQGEELAKLREAVEKAPHGISCAFYMPVPNNANRWPCNCWKRAALGE